MDLTLSEAARALYMPERELLRLARAGRIPACRINDEYLFNSVELAEWGADHKRKMAPDLSSTSAASSSLSIADAIAHGGVHHDVPGATRDELLEAVTRLPTIPERVDRTLLAQVLKSREALASTGIGGGIAIPHPRDPLVVGVEVPFVLLCFPVRPLDFGAIDHAPVTTVFTLLSPSVALHLRVLSRLAHALHDDVLLRLLAIRADRDPILKRLRELEATMVDRPEAK